MHAALVIILLMWLSGLVAAVILIYYDNKDHNNPGIIRYARDILLAAIWPLFILFVLIGSAATALRENRFPDTPF